MDNHSQKPSFIKRNPAIPDKEYIQLVRTLKEQFQKSQIKTALKVNTALLEFYWGMGREISRLYDKARYGSAFFDCLSLDLKAEFPGQTGFSTTNIKYIKRWYEFYTHETPNRHQVGDDLDMPLEFGRIPWKHHVHIFMHSRRI